MNLKYNVIYYLLFVCALYLSFKASITNLIGLKAIRILLVGGLVSEIVVDILKYHEKSYNFIYYFYLPFEFMLLLVLFFRENINKSNKRIELVLAVVYFILYLILIFYYYDFSQYPSIIYNVGSFLIIPLLIHSLFSLDQNGSIKITDLPNFWIFTGLLVLYSGVIFYNAVYNYLLQEKTELAKSLRLVINLNLNYIFYSTWSYAFICSIRLKKSSIQLSQE